MQPPLSRKTSNLRHKIWAITPQLLRNGGGGPIFANLCCDGNLAKEITFVFDAVFHREVMRRRIWAVFRSGRPFNKEILSNGKYYRWNEKYQRLNCQH